MLGICNGIRAGRRKGWNARIRLVSAARIAVVALVLILAGCLRPEMLSGPSQTPRSPEATLPEWRVGDRWIYEWTSVEAATVQHRRAARARAVEDGRGPVGVAHPPHLGRDLVKRLVPADALELSRPARPRAPQRVQQAVGMVHALELSEPAHARVQRRHLGRPLAGIGADAHDPPVAHVGVDHAPPAAVCGRTCS